MRSRKFKLYKFDVFNSHTNGYDPLSGFTQVGRRSNIQYNQLHVYQNVETITYIPTIRHRSDLCFAMIFLRIFSRRFRNTRTVQTT